MKARVSASFWAALLACSAWAHAQAIAPGDFAYGAPIALARAAAAYRFALPLSVYQNTVRADLGDLRVFNAEGAVVPFALSRPAAQSLIHKTPVALPLFPLHDGARVLIDGMHLTINSLGSAVNLQTQNGTPVTPAVRQYLLDARALDTTLSALQLAWPDAAAEYTGRLNVEVSDDLSAWRSLVVAAPIANLRANGQTLIENRLEFAPTQAKFWRLTWLGMAPSFELSGVQAEPAASLTEPTRAVLDVSGVADPKDAREYQFDLGAHPPVSRVNLQLPDANSVVDVELSSRPTAGAPWRAILHAGFYRLKTTDAEQQNAPLEVTADADRYWRARMLGSGSVPSSPPRLHLEWIPNEVTFLAQGQAPFRLAYGNATADRGEADLSRLPNTLEAVQTTLGPQQVAGGADRLLAQATPFPRMRIALWGALLLAVAILGFMAYRVAKDPTPNPP